MSLSHSFPINDEPFNQLHAPWQAYWPTSEQWLLAIGIEAEREANWLARAGAQLVVLPAAATASAEQAARYSLFEKPPEQAIRHLQDSLPELAACYQLNRKRP